MCNSFFYTLYFIPCPPHPPSDCVTSHTSSPPYPHRAWPLNSLGTPVSWGLSASSLNEHRSGSPLLYVCWEPQSIWCMLPVWWFSVWEILGVQINWDCGSSCRITIFLSFFQPSLIKQEVSSFCPLVGCKYLYLTLSAACWVFQRAVMIDPFLWVLHSLSNSVRPWDLPLSWIPLWACHWTFFSSGSSPFPSL